MLETIKQLDKKYYMNTFGERTNVCFTSGDGVFLYDTDGKKYYDFFGGIAVNALGHGNRNFIGGLCGHLQNSVIHTSNVYYIQTQAELARELVTVSCADKVFFGNSGAEANEAAFKLAKMYNYKKGNHKKSKIITLVNSFHGRTLAAVAATGQEKYQQPYKPLTPGFIHVPMNDIELLKQNIDDEVCAIMAELIQGESGVYPLTAEYAAELRKICDERDILLIFDEVQTGMGRTGTMFAYQQYGIEPDIFTIAKALGGGIPIGAALAKDFVASAFSPGDHGSTFGGNPFACKAGLLVLEEMKRLNLPENARDVGNYLKGELQKIGGGKIKEVRGMGLMLGIEFTDGIAKDTAKALLDAGFLVGCVGLNIIRLLPPIILTTRDADEFIKALGGLL